MKYHRAFLHIKLRRINQDHRKQKQIKKKKKTSMSWPVSFGQCMKQSPPN